MKTILVILLFISFSGFHSQIRLNKADLSENDVQTSPCPANNKKAEDTLQEYLQDGTVIKKLRNNSNITLNSFSQDKIHALEDRMYQDECKKLIENSPWLDNFEFYSLYKVENYYFVVNYSLTDENEFEYRSTTIVDKYFEVVAISTKLDF